MRAIAWDDRPDEYMNDLADELRRLKVEVVVCTTMQEFNHAFHPPGKAPGAGWDFVLTDLYTGDNPAVQEADAKTGVQIAQRADKAGLPVFMVTQHFTRSDPAELHIPPRVVVRSKSTDAGWMAADIVENLQDRGRFSDPGRVFLIFGHDRAAGGTTAAIEAHLRDRGVTVDKVTPDTLFTEINAGLVGRMNGCRAIVAVYTPDDRVETAKGVYYQPRPNVLYEFGIALGLARGVDRLTVIEKKGDAPDQQVQMPSDLRGLLPLRFTYAVDEVFPRLDARLAELGVQLK